ncbi:MAG: hypothetical protein ACR2P0_18585 [Acidimicrobiales bacterium]
MDQVFERIAAVREHRGLAVDRVRSGELSLDGLFAEAAVDPVLSSAKILPFIEVIPEIGKVRSRRALAAAGIDEAALISAVDGVAHGRLGDALDRA